MHLIFQVSLWSKKGHAPPLYYTIEIGYMSNFVAKCYALIQKNDYFSIFFKNIYKTLKISYNNRHKFVGEKYDKFN